MKKPSKSFEIALSAVACAVIIIFLMLGSLTAGLLVTGYLVATFALMVPLSKDFIWGSALCYLAAGLVALPVCLWKVVPYFVFFGLHPIVNALQRKFVHRRLFQIFCSVCKAVWFDFAMWLSWYVLTAMAGMVFLEYVEQYLYLLIFVGGTLFFFIYDFLIFQCQKTADAFIARIRR